MVIAAAALSTALTTESSVGPLISSIDWAQVRTWIGALLILLGAVLTLIAAIGVAIRKDPYERMHVASKPQYLGLIVLCTGIVVETASLWWLITGVVVLILQAVTVPVGSHLVARAFDRTHRLDEPADEEVQY
ncbi:cation:proton antiporter [Schaalia suimastitidis]|uniref:cation:proton antiporter n=1 Tax=Schaalia suimastitidis TaxID=121163 RepID=UPI0004264A03|nr:monovalent cation/H(+) antiporter subunit G [Schaalia suimastitidis]